MRGKFFPVLAKENCKPRLDTNVFTIFESNLLESKDCVNLFLEFIFLVKLYLILLPAKQVGR